MAGKKNKLKIIDLFAGVGGISSGFKKAGFDVIAANEYKADIANTYIKNHPGTKMIVEDITKIKSKDLVDGEEIDVIVGVDLILGRVGHLQNRVMSEKKVPSAEGRVKTVGSGQ